MTKIEGARLSDERATRLLQLLSVGAKLTNRAQEKIVSPETQPICKDSLQGICSPGKDDVFEDCILDGGSAGKEFVSLRELELGEEGLRKSLNERPSAETRCKLETEWRNKAHSAAKKVSGNGNQDVCPFGYGVTFENRLLLADVPELHQWAEEKEKEFKRKGRCFYEITFV